MLAFALSEAEPRIFDLQIPIMKKLALFSIVVFSLSSCVSSKVYKELQSKFADLEAENVDLRKERDEAQSALKLAEGKLANLEQELGTLREKSAESAAALSSLQSRYQDLNRSYEYLLENNNNLLASNQKENQKLVEKLNKLQEELNRKEDSLRIENERLEKLSAAMQSREARISELESAIARKDSTVKMVRQRLKDALLNFDGKGLTVEDRNGKVYVSLSNKLLFPSASWEVQSEGKKALDELAIVLAENPDLQVTVEGHTDADAFNGRTAVKDNWDLSVMRATSIVKIIVANEGVNKANITAAGRSEYMPIADNDSPEGKAKNRRTEIIIEPDLSELNDLLED